MNTETLREEIRILKSMLETKTKANAELVRMVADIEKKYENLKEETETCGCSWCR